MIRLTFMQKLQIEKKLNLFQLTHISHSFKNK